MKNGSLRDGESSEVVRLILLAAVVSVVMIQLVRGLIAESFGSGGLLHDADVYMWLVRVEALVEGGGWFEHLETRVNPPEGDVQHWTRLLDFLLLVGGKALSPLFGFRDGLAIWAAMVSPILHVLAIFGVYQTGRLLLPRREAAFAAGIFGAHYATIITFLWGRGDHHSLLTFGQVLFCMALVWAYLGPVKRRKWWGLLAGIIGGISIWVNVEALGYVLLGLIFAGLWWLWGKKEELEVGALMGIGLLGAMILAVGIERGPYFFDEFPVDTMGIAYVTLFGLTALFFVALIPLRRWKVSEGLPGRIGLVVVLAAAVLGTLALVHPVFFLGPFEGVDPLYGEIRLSNLSEQASALEIEKGWSHFLGYLLIWYGLVPLALFGAYRGWKKSDGRGQGIWGLLIGMGLLFSVLGLGQVRWLAYQPLGIAFGAALAVGMGIDRLKKESWYREALGRPVIIMTVFYGVTVLGLGIAALGGSGVTGGSAAATTPSGEMAGEDGQEEANAVVSPAEVNDCDLRRASVQLREYEDVKLILLEPDRGSEILYRTEHQILTIANHRVQPGFAFFVATMREQDEAKAVKALRERGVDLVMVCAASVWSYLRGTPEEPSMMERWSKGEATPGLVIWGRGEELRGWWIYEVRPEEGDDEDR